MAQVTIGQIFRYLMSLSYEAREYSIDEDEKKYQKTKDKIDKIKSVIVEIDDSVFEEDE